MPPDSLGTPVFPSTQSPLVSTPSSTPFVSPPDIGPFSTRRHSGPWSTHSVTVVMVWVCESPYCLLLVHPSHTPLSNTHISPSLPSYTLNTLQSAPINPFIRASIKIKTFIVPRYSAAGPEPRLTSSATRICSRTLSCRTLRSISGTVSFKNLLARSSGTWIKSSR